MNKTKRLRVLLAATTLAGATAASAQAPANVTLGGLMDLSIGETKAPGGSRSRGIDSGKMTTSYVSLRGTEDLGDGLAAVFALESFMRADTGAAGRFNGDTFWARNSWVGLAHKSYGRVTLGRNTTPLFVSTLLFNAFGDSFGYSPSIRHYFTSGTVSGDTGWNDSVQVTSPSLGGATVSLIGAASEGSNGRNWGGHALYFGGPLAATFAFEDVKKDAGAPTADTRTWQLGGSYAVGTVKGFGQVGNVKNRTSGVDFDLLGLGASVDIDAGKALVQWGRLKPSTGAKRNTFSVGYDHFVSKRTDLYAVVMSDKVDGLSSGSGWSLGIRHRY